MQCGQCQSEHVSEELLFRSFPACMDVSPTDPSRFAKGVSSYLQEPATAKSNVTSLGPWDVGRALQTSLARPPPSIHAVVADINNSSSYKVATIIGRLWMAAAIRGMSLDFAARGAIFFPPLVFGVGWMGGSTNYDTMEGWHATAHVQQQQLLGSAACIDAVRARAFCYWRIKPTVCRIRKSLSSIESVEYFGVDAILICL